MTVSTHVLDATAGTPAAGVAVSLSYLDPYGLPEGEWTPVGAGETDVDGRHLFAEPTGRTGADWS